MLSTAQTRNFEVLRKAFLNGDVALMDCQLVATEESVAIICCVQREADGDEIFIPFAMLFNTDPYELLRPPSPDGGYQK